MDIREPERREVERGSQPSAGQHMRTDITDIRLIRGENDPQAKMAAELAATRARFDAICARIADPEFNPAELSRLIACEIAMLTKDMLSRRFTAEDGYILRGFAEQMKALRELGKQLMDAEVWSKKEDILSFNGEEFKFAMGKFVNLFVEAMKEAGVPQDLRFSVMKHHRDLMAASEPVIRRETEKLGSKKRA